MGTGSWGTLVDDGIVESSTHLSTLESRQLRADIAILRTDLGDGFVDDENRPRGRGSSQARPPTDGTDTLLYMLLQVEKERREQLRTTLDLPKGPNRNPVSLFGSKSGYWRVSLLLTVPARSARTEPATRRGELPFKNMFASYEQSISSDTSHTDAV